MITKHSEVKEDEKLAREEREKREKEKFCCFEEDPDG